MWLCMGRLSLQGSPTLFLPDLVFLNQERCSCRHPRTLPISLKMAGSPSATTQAREVTTCKVYCPDREGLTEGPRSNQKLAWVCVDTNFCALVLRRAGQALGGQVLCHLDLSCGKGCGQRKNGETLLESRSQGGHCCLGPKGDTVCAHEPYKTKHSLRESIISPQNLQSSKVK